MQFFLKKGYQIFYDGEVMVFFINFNYLHALLIHIPYFLKRKLVLLMKNPFFMHCLQFKYSKVM